MTLGIIDYGRGNLRSVINACRSLGQEPTLVQKPEHFEGLTHLIFPGQGAFGECMDSLHRLELSQPLTHWIKNGKPFFGICVGYQLLFENSDESPGTSGLGVIKGTVKKFQSTDVKIPHMGWNHITLTHPSDPIWSGLTDSPYFYFVHSYYPVPTDSSVIAATTEYGEETFCAAVQQGSLFATQFHPEKSQHAGLQLISQFLEA